MRDERTSGEGRASQGHAKGSISLDGDAGDKVDGEPAPEVVLGNDLEPPLAHAVDLDRQEEVRHHIDNKIPIPYEHCKYKRSYRIADARVQHLDAVSTDTQ